MLWFQLITVLKLRRLESCNSYRDTQMRPLQILNCSKIKSVILLRQL
jgi:hypothetical protein